MSLLEHKHFLNFFLQATQTERRNILRSLSDKQLDILTKILFNVLYNPKIKLTATTIKKLKPFKKNLGILTNRRTNRSRRRRLYKQVGSGLFSVLLPTIAALISAATNG